MRIVRRLAAALALASALPAAALGAGPDRVDLTYRVFLGGLPIVEIDAQTTVDEGGRYRMDNLTRTVGLWESLFKARMLTRVDGRLDAKAEDGARPSLFQVRYDGRVGKRRSVDVYFNANGPSDIFAVPPNAEDGRRPVEPEFLLGATDPATAALLAAESGPEDRICQRSFKIFDGRRRYDVAFENKGTDHIDGGNGDFYEGEATHCLIRYKRIKGFDPQWERSDARNYPNEVHIWFVRFPDLPRAIPVKVQVKTEYGVTVAQLIRRALAKGEPLSDAAALLPPPDMKGMGG
ncbi:DUF3108 domain-containing protein [Zavarzinia aquatilis]|uniref:DUF3108 domain-containing protein n=1 Tax=Zavarzinia aquatilis TaxID=2211142 RepID=A0A317DXF9_9PROT|nr:DUF3108 domain-containing protein [Zavarzinia aquatilis]PWR18610.1 hypothetical protein DKG74_18460 [Zavarzinia aquatilis]